MKSGTKSPTKSPVKGGTKPQPGTRRAEKFQDGANKSGGIRATSRRAWTTQQDPPLRHQGRAEHRNRP